MGYVLSVLLIGVTLAVLLPPSLRILRSLRALRAAKTRLALDAAERGGLLRARWAGLRVGLTFARK